MIVKNAHNYQSVNISRLMHVFLLSLCLIILSLCYKVLDLIILCTDTDIPVATKKSAKPAEASRNINWIIKKFVSLYSMP